MREEIGREKGKTVVFANSGGKEDEEGVTSTTVTNNSPSTGVSVI